MFTPDDPFFVDWDAFYRAIDNALVAAGLDRYKDWAVRVAEDPDIIEFKVAPSKKRRAREELPDWFRSATAPKPATKKPKKEEVRRTLLPYIAHPSIGSPLSINVVLHTSLDNS